MVGALAEAPDARADVSAQERFSRSLAAAKANLASAEGQAFDRVLAAHLRERNAAVLEGCFRSNPEPDLTPFEVVFQLAKSGLVLDALVWPETDTGVCFRDGLKTKTVPAPPQDAYWAQLRMSFGR